MAMRSSEAMRADTRNRRLFWPRNYKQICFFVFFTQPEQPLPELNGNHADLPGELHAHLTDLLTQKQKRQRVGDSPRMNQSQFEVTLWCLESLIGDVRMPQCLKTGEMLYVS